MPYQGEAGWKAVCQGVLARPLPPGAAALAAHAKSLSSSSRPGQSPSDGFDAEALYYGFGKPPDYGTALACAYRQRAYPNPSNGSSFVGPGILAMLYANGDSVSRDYALAIRFACETDGAEAESEGRIGHLEALRDGKLAAAKAASNPATGPFDLCDDATSGMMQGACEDHAQRFAEAKRDRLPLGLKTRLPVAAQAMLPQVEGAERAFEKARGRYEIAPSGTGRAAFVLEDQGRLRDQFSINLQRFAAGELPPATMNRRMEAKRELGAAFAAVQKAPATSWQYGTIQPHGVAVAEGAGAGCRVEPRLYLEAMTKLSRWVVMKSPTSRSEAPPW